MLMAEFNYTAVRAHLLETGRYQAEHMSHLKRLVQQGQARGLAPDDYNVAELYATLGVMAELYLDNAGDNASERRSW